MHAVSSLKNEKNLRFCSAGQVIFNEGDPGDYMCSVVEGEVEIYKRGRLIESVGQDGIFGELSLVDDRPRNATAMARTHCTLAIVDARRFAILVQQNPYFSLEVMRVMAERLRDVMNPTSEE